MFRRAAFRLLPLLLLALSIAPVSHSAPPETRPPEGLREATPAVFALTGARIVVAPGKVVERGTLVVRDGVIEAVGADAAVPADATYPADAVRIDMSGRTLYAGLIDAYSEAANLPPTNGGAPHWNSNVTPQLRVAASYQADAAQNVKLRGQGVTARLVAPPAGIIKGTSALVTTADEPGERSLLKADVAQHLRLTIPFGRNRDQYPNSPMGAVALARQTLLDAEWYGRAWQAYEANHALPRPERNDALAALQPLARGEGLAIVDASNELFHLRADRFAREFGLPIAVRGSGHEYKRLEAIRAAGRAVIVPVNFPKPSNVATPEAALDASLGELLHWDIAPENPDRLDRAGVKIALSSQGLDDAKNFLAQVRIAVERGLDPDAALRALTTTPAELFGVSERLGTLEAGKSADFVVTDGDLFTKKTKVLETWIAGRRFEFAAPPRNDIRGEWQTKISPPGGKTVTATLKFSGSESGPTGVLVLPKPNAAGEKQKDDQDQDEKEKEAEPSTDEIKLERLAVRDARLSATFNSKPLGQEGVALISAVVSSAGGAKPEDEQPAATLVGEIVWPDGTRTPLEAQRTKEQEDEQTQKPGNEEKKGEEKKEEHKESGSDEPKASQEEKAVAGASFRVNYPLGAFGRTAPPEQSEAIVFQGATVWTCGPAGTLENASVLVARGKIVAVGKELEVPEGAVVVDAKGMHISPGIIDCHSHMATDGGVNESAQAITAEVRIGDFIDSDDVNIYRQLAGGVTSSNILHGSANPIGGQNQVIKLRWGELPEALKFADAPAGIKFALGENVKQSNWGDRYTSRYPQSRMGVEQIIRDEFAAARTYRRHWDAWSRDHAGLPPRRDLELEAIDEVLRRQRWVHCHSYRQDEILALIRTFDHYGITIGSLQHILEGYKVAREMAEHGATGSAFSDWWAYKIEVYDAIPYNGALMHRAGVVVSFNSDDRELARHLNHEAAKAVKYGGVSPDEALKFVTLNPAKQLRIDRFVGSLEPGKHADLVLWSAPPLSTLSRCEQTWIDGRKYFDRTDDRRQRDEVRSMKAALIQKILGSGQEMRKPGERDGDESDLWPRHDEFCHTHDHDAH
jgi:N-acetylglucosamine-6-phosphate deacetylase